MGNEDDRFLAAFQNVSLSANLCVEHVVPPIGAPNDLYLSFSDLDQCRGEVHIIGMSSETTECITFSLQEVILKGTVVKNQTDPKVVSSTIDSPKVVKNQTDPKVVSSTRDTRPTVDFPRDTSISDSPKGLEPLPKKPRRYFRWMTLLEDLKRLFPVDFLNKYPGKPPVTAIKPILDAADIETKQRLSVVTIGQIQDKLKTLYAKSTRENFSINFVQPH